MEIRCNQSARNTALLKAFNVVLFIFQVVLALCFPAFPLALPDFVFNFQEELEKEQNELDSNRRRLDTDNPDDPDNQQGQELTQYQRFRDHDQRDSSAEGDQNRSEPEILVRSDDENSVFCCSVLRRVTVRRSHTNSSPVRSDYERIDGDNQGRVQDEIQNRQDSGTGGDQHPSKQKSVYMDDASPITFCNLVKRMFVKYSGCLQYLKFSFNIKLAFLVICVAPFFFYLRFLLALTIKRRVFDESAEKKLVILDGWQLFSPLFFQVKTSFDITAFKLILLGVIPFVAILSMRPHDFLCDQKEWLFGDQCKCCICREHFISVGADMRRHIEKWQLNFKRFVAA